MKRKFFHLLIATSLITPFNYDAPLRGDVRVEEKRDAAQQVDAASRLEVYVGSNARWIVDQRQGVVYAYSLENDRPLWSSDGVVFRLAALRKNLAITSFKNPLDTPSKPALEIAKRVYFIVDDGAPPKKSSRDRTVLIALDPQAQGRVVWELHVDQFASLFAPDESAPSFFATLEPLAGDELLVRVQNARTVKNFAVDAATGRVRPLTQ